MNLYEAIFTRCSVRNYIMEPIEDKIFENMNQFWKIIVPLFTDIEIKIDIIDTFEKNDKVKGLFHVKAPYYLVFYSEKKEKYLMNAGYMLQQISLFFETQGLGSCYLGSLKIKKNTDRNMEYVIAMAFGKSSEKKPREKNGIKRLSLEELSVIKETPRPWAKQVLEAARLAPSSMNSQPWRFIVYENRIHIFCKKQKLPMYGLNKWTELDFGIMLAHIMVVAEELWIDIDLIKLNNITHKSVPNNHYVISAILKP